MSYQVLARKWRPRNFREMAGQEHVLKTLINALENNRLHHAYLFTGTRGVGKTTIARILARCLNCEKGITATPCGECTSCIEINEGRFLDLIEVDAASRTKVEDTRELLENVQYAPSRGRFKVYLIDEVHMLSSHSFNALLKTLEEPPPHVKFLLATTDPQKLPITVLSRCLQFNLKNLTPERLVEHLKHILVQEEILFEEGALWQLGRAAQGSVRDCLTLLDQAIGYCEGRVTDKGVSEFLGNLDRTVIVKMMDALAAQDAASLLHLVADAAQHSPDFALVFQELLSWLHRVAIAQVVPEAIDNALGDREQVLAHAGLIPAETLQLYYQIALKGREDLPLALDPRSGLEMTLLRMVAFTPVGVPKVPKVPLPQSNQALADESVEEKKKPLICAEQPLVADANIAADREVLAEIQAVEKPQSVDPNRFSENVSPFKDESAAESLSEREPRFVPEHDRSQTSQHHAIPSATSTESGKPQIPVDPVPPTPLRDERRTAETVEENCHGSAQNNEAQKSVEQSSQITAQSTFQPVAPSSVSVPEQTPVDTIKLADLRPEHWTRLFNFLALSGVTRSMAGNSVLTSVEGNTLHLCLAEQSATIYNDEHRKRIELALTQYFSLQINLLIEIGQVTGETPSAYRQRREREHMQAATRNFTDNAVVKALLENFSAEIRAESIKPLLPLEL